MNAWEMPQVQALGEERLRLMQEAAEKCRGKSGMERLDIFLEYGEKLSEGGPLAPEEQKALLAAVAASLPEQRHSFFAESSSSSSIASTGEPPPCGIVFSSA